MEELKTPRDTIDDDKYIWSNEIEDLLSEWAEKSGCYQWLHRYSERKYKKKSHAYQIPIIILSTVCGIGNFGADSYVPKDYQSGFSAFVGSLNVLTGILGTLLSFLRYSEIYEGHRISALSWSKLSRSIQIELALKDERRKPCRDFLKVTRAEYDRLLESSPSIDQDVINIFKKRFNDDYPDVRRPVICNGLEECKVYKEEERFPKIHSDKIKRVI